MIYGSGEMIPAVFLCPGSITGLQAFPIAAAGALDRFRIHGNKKRPAFTGPENSTAIVLQILLQSYCIYCIF